MDFCGQIRKMQAIFSSSNLHFWKYPIYTLLNDFNVCDNIL